MLLQLTKIALPSNISQLYERYFDDNKLLALVLSKMEKYYFYSFSGCITEFKK